MKLKITQLEIDADAETLGRALPILARIAQGSTIELPPAVDPPAALPAPKPSEPDCCREPLPPKPRRQYKPRKPKDDKPPARSQSPRASQPVDESSGPLRVDTGRSKERETIDALRECGPCGAGRLAGFIGGGVSSGAVYQRLLALMAKGLVRKGRDAGTFEAIDDE